MGMAADYLVEVRDRNLVRVGQIAEEYMDVQFIEVFRAPGAWRLKLPSEHPLLPALKTKGSGVIITQRSSGHVFSGRMKSCILSQDAKDPKGTWLVTGVDDNIVGAAVTVLPDPAHAADAQEEAYWVSSGAAETVMKAAVNLNASAGAIPARQYPWLTVATDLARGAAVTTSVRFNKLGDVLTSLGVTAHLGWRFVQVADSIEFDVFETSDKTALVVLDIRNGGLESTELGFSAPQATEVLVLGQGQGAERTVRRVTSAEADAEAAEWGLRWESSKDQRNTDDPDELQAAGDEVLEESGTTVHSLKVVPSDSPNQRLGLDWGLGDKVTVVIDSSPAEAVVSEIATSISSAGVLKSATVGDPVGFDWEARVGAAVRDHDSRITGLETKIGSTESLDADITTLQGEMTTAQSAISGAQGAITTLDGRVTANEAAILVDATTTVKGRTKLSTDAIAVTGTATDVVTTPANLKAVLATRKPFAEQEDVTVMTTVNYAAGNGVAVVVNFASGLFTQAPVVTLGLQGSTRFNYGIVALSASSMTLRVDNFTSGAAGATSIHWHAVQMTSGSAPGVGN